MTGSAVAGLTERVAGPVVLGAPLSGYTTYRIGGPAAALVEPRDAEDVAAALAFAADRDLPWLVIGLGSNLLVGDRGFPGVVLRMGSEVATLPADRGEAVWRVGAGVPTPLLARRTAGAGWNGLHRLIGVPGTVGGGVFMNAGAHGQAYADVVRSVSVITPGGEMETRAAADIAWAYRDSGLGNVVIVDATLAFTPADPKTLRADIAQHFRWRRAGTPFSEPCCGSVFRNPTAPPGWDPADGAPTAGRLIDRAGMKGFQLGGARVSERHANYIVNTGTATAGDVRAVIDAVGERVHRTLGVQLELEVRLVGER